MYSDFNFGKILSLKFLQCGHVKEAYSITSIGAASMPKLISITAGLSVSACAAIVPMIAIQTVDTSVIKNFMVYVPF